MNQTTNGKEPVKVLTIGGSDSGGAAGVQADLRAWALLGAYGMSAITAATAQNSLTVNGVQFMSPAFVTAQCEAVFGDYGVQAVKTGFIGRADLVIAVSACLQKQRPAYLVVDPVLVNHRGLPMFPEVVRQLYLAYLLPAATLITPNRQETAVLLQSSLPQSHELARLANMARRLHQLGADQVLLKGGRDGDEMVDIFFDGRTVQQLRSTYIPTENTHGAGDTLSAAVCAFLAQGVGMETAVKQARAFTARAVRNGADWRLGAGHGPVFPTVAEE